MLLGNILLSGDLNLCKVLSFVACVSLLGGIFFSFDLSSRELLAFASGVLFATSIAAMVLYEHHYQVQNMRKNKAPEEQWYDFPECQWHDALQYQDQDNLKPQEQDQRKVQRREKMYRAKQRKKNPAPVYDAAKYVVSRRPDAVKGHRWPKGDLN